MLRRLHAARVFVGDVPLDPTQARHARDVLRLPDGTPVEVFDDTGNVAVGTLDYARGEPVVVKVDTLAPRANAATQIAVASAIPKGERADWMVEKLSELGVARFIPLAAGRSVTLPSGKSKFERWTRLATESAKQSRRAGIMVIDPLTPVEELLTRHAHGLVLSTNPDSLPFPEAIARLVQREGEAPAEPGFSHDVPNELFLAIGPEGGWTEAELTGFSQAGYVAAGLTPTILRTETAAVTAAALAIVLQSAPQNTEGTRH